MLVFVEDRGVVDYEANLKQLDSIFKQAWKFLKLLKATWNNLKQASIKLKTTWKSMKQNLYNLKHLEITWNKLETTLEQLDAKYKQFWNILKQL